MSTPIEIAEDDRPCTVPGVVIGTLEVPLEKLGMTVTAKVVIDPDEVAGKIPLGLLLDQVSGPKDDASR